jgi:hypothetical protein
LGGRTGTGKIIYLNLVGARLARCGLVPVMRRVQQVEGSGDGADFSVVILPPSMLPPRALAARATPVKVIWF